MLLGKRLNTIVVVVILSVAKNLKGEILRCAQDDKSFFIRDCHGSFLNCHAMTLEKAFTKSYKQRTLMNKIKLAFVAFFLIMGICLGVKVFFLIQHTFHENKVLKQVVERLSSESQVAEVLVTKAELDEDKGKIRTTIKFLEFDVEGKPLEPKYFTFFGNQIQFQSLVIRFKDDFVKKGDGLKGKSIYLFLKAFVLDGKDTQEMIINPVSEIPKGYKLEVDDLYEQRLWNRFWDYALNPETKEIEGIKSAQLEAPGTLFIPGTIYTLHIEHDGGLRIDAKPIPAILKGEVI